MKKFSFVLAAVGAMAVAVPAMASAQTVVIKRGHHHGWHGARAQMHHDRGWHRGWNDRHGDRVVVIKKRYHRY